MPHGLDRSPSEPFKSDMVESGEVFQPRVSLARQPLGQSGLNVSVLALGTVALGLNYGLPGSTSPTRLDFDAAVELVRRAWHAGINFFDTAPAYGTAEAIVGAALSRMPDAVVASKVGISDTWRDLSAAEVLGEMRRSVERSLTILGRSRLDVLKLHSATEQNLTNKNILHAFEALRSEKLVTATGATVYGEAAALTAIGSGVVDVIQVAFSMLDQRPVARVFLEANVRKVAIVTRSALLKGALTKRWRVLPPKLAALQEVISRLLEDLDLDDATLPDAALRFCLSHVPPVTAVLIGPSSLDELDEALDSAAAGALPEHLRSWAARFAISDEDLIDPSRWGAV